MTVYLAYVSSLADMVVTGERRLGAAAATVTPESGGQNPMGASTA
jgi:hypothetical protein